MREKKVGVEQLIPHQAVQTCLSERSLTKDALLSQSGLNKTIIVELDQVHSNNVVEVPFSTQNYNYPDTSFAQADALMTKEKNTTLVIRTADCLPVLIYHSSGVIAAVHAGRKGTEEGILKETLLLMKKRLSNNHGMFWIWFGPCICFDCYEVDKKTKAHFDLIGKNKDQLNSVLDKDQYHLTLFQSCTSCDNYRFFSYRKEGQKAGRIYSVISIK